MNLLDFRHEISAVQLPCSVNFNTHCCYKRMWPQFFQTVFDCGLSGRLSVHPQCVLGAFTLVEALCLKYNHQNAC